MKIDTKRKIDRAKLLLMTQRGTTFFSSLLASLRLKESKAIPTAAVDGVHLFYNKEFVDKLTPQETLGLLLHETLHVALDHLDRKKLHDLDPQGWNIAGDYYINNDLDNRGYKLPEGGLIDHKYDGWSTMKIYGEVMKDKPEDFEMDLLGPPDGMSDEECTEVVKNAVVKAVTQAKISNDYGSVPGEIARRVEEILNPVLPWNVIFMNRLSAYAKDDYTWRRPNRRYWPDAFLPSMYSESLDEIIVAIDVSGSIMQEDLDAFMAEITYVWSTLHPKKMRILGFDTEIHDDLEFTEGDSLESVNLTGGGGTYIGPVIDTIHKDNPEITIIFTDAEFTLPHLDDIESDLIWIIKGNHPFEPSKGEVVRFQ